MQILAHLQPSDLKRKIERLWDVSAGKILSIDRDEMPGAATPVFTVQGKYTSRGWTEWTQGFVYGSAILQFDAFWDPQFLKLGRERTVDRMAHHVTHMGVHDHGFNNVSTYGNLWRLMGEGRIAENRHERAFYELALKCSGAVQAARWTNTASGEGFIYSFNGPHSLFADTIRSLRALALAHRLGHVLMGERDEKKIAAAPARRARAGDGAVGGVLRGRPRCFRRAGARGAREYFQCERRLVPLPEFAAGLVAVHDVDARAGVDHVRFCGAARMGGDAARSRAGEIGRAHV